MTTGEMTPEGMISIGPRDLFLAFFKIGIQGFGGVLPWARRVLVEERKWFTEEEFIDAWGLAQALPGGNIINLSIGFGSRCAGPLGAMAAFVLSAIVKWPLALVLLVFALSRFWERHRGQRWNRTLTAALAPIAVGLTLAGGYLVTLGAGSSTAAYILIGITVLATLLTRLHPIWFIGLGALAGLLGWV